MELRPSASPVPGCLPWKLTGYSAAHRHRWTRPLPVRHRTLLPASTPPACPTGSGLLGFAHRTQAERGASAAWTPTPVRASAGARHGHDTQVKLFLCSLPVIRAASGSSSSRGRARVLMGPQTEATP